MNYLTSSDNSYETPAQLTEILNAVARAQLTLQMLTLQKNIILRHLGTDGLN